MYPDRRWRKQITTSPPISGALSLSNTKDYEYRAKRCSSERSRAEIPSFEGFAGMHVQILGRYLSLIACCSRLFVIRSAAVTTGRGRPVAMTPTSAPC